MSLVNDLTGVPVMNSFSRTHDGHCGGVEEGRRGIVRRHHTPGLADGSGQDVSEDPDLIA